MSSRELRACGWHGHVTYAPSEPELAARLRAETALGTAWRCLRCGDWVLGPPASEGPAARAPVPARGRALRHLLILRLLAVERMLRALILVAAAYGVHRFASAQTSLQATFGDLLPAARPLAERLGIDLDQTTIIRDATKALHARQETLTLVAIGLLLYGLLEAVEAVGLWLAKRCGRPDGRGRRRHSPPAADRQPLNAVTVIVRRGLAGDLAVVIGRHVARAALRGARGWSAYERGSAAESCSRSRARAGTRGSGVTRPATCPGATWACRRSARPAWSGRSTWTAPHRGTPGLGPPRSARLAGRASSSLSRRRTDAGSDVPGGTTCRAGTGSPGTMRSGTTACYAPCAPEAAVAGPSSASSSSRTHGGPGADLDRRLVERQLQDHGGGRAPWPSGAAPCSSAPQQAFRQRPQRGEVRPRVGTGRDRQKMTAER